MNIEAMVQEKYGRYFGTTFSSIAELNEDLAGGEVFIAGKPWEEFGVTLAELADNNMWNEIVIIHTNAE